MLLRYFGIDFITLADFWHLFVNFLELIRNISDFFIHSPNWGFHELLGLWLFEFLMAKKHLKLIQQFTVGFVDINRLLWARLLHLLLTWWLSIGEELLRRDESIDSLDPLELCARLLLEFFFDLLRDVLLSFHGLYVIPKSLQISFKQLNLVD